jgi:hypothetical protein
MIVVIDGAYGVSSQIGATVRTSERAQLVAHALYAHVRDGDDPPTDSSPRPELGPGDTGGQATRAVTRIVDAGSIPDGTILQFRPVTTPERKQLPRWLDEDPRRAQASWQNNKRTPLVWAADGQAYAPSNLVRLIRREALGNNRQVQGTLYWHVPGKGSLVDLARETDEGESVHSDS